MQLGHGHAGSLSWSFCGVSISNVESALISTFRNRHREYGAEGSGQDMPPDMPPDMPQDMPQDMG